MDGCASCVLFVFGNKLNVTRDRCLSESVLYFTKFVTSNSVYGLNALTVLGAVFGPLAGAVFANPR